MVAVVASLSRLVRRLPRATIVAVLVITVVLGGMSSRIQMAAGMDGFAPDNIHLDAAETLGERFGGAGEEVLQIVVEAPPGADVISAEGLRTVAAVERALLDADEARHLATPEGQPTILTPIAPTVGALEQQGADLDAIDDATVRAAFAESRDALPEGQAGLLDALLPEDADPSAATADAALLLAFVSADGLPLDGVERLDAMIDIELGLLDAAEQAELAPGYAVTGFAFSLLFSDESFEAELARLFATAFAIIVVILATVYWLRPGAALRPMGAGRRTLADVLLTMATIVMAITWMNGAAVLLGPDYLQVIGPLTDATQIVPVLLIGLGVDYAIHLVSRYREEVGAGASVDEAVVRAMRNVGLALGLATVTTAVGFLTNVFNPVPTMRDFGVLAAVGITAAFVLMLTFVPAIRLLLDRRAQRLDRLPATAIAGTSRRLLPATMARTAVLAERGPVATLAVTVLLGGSLGVWGFSQLETRFSSTDFVAPDNPILTAMETIEDRFGGGLGETTEVLVSGDVTRPEVHEALVDATERLGDVEGVTTIDGQVAAESPVSLIGALLAPGPDGAPVAPEVAEVAGAEGVRSDLSFPQDADVPSVYEAAHRAAPQQAERVLDLVGGEVVRGRVSVPTAGGENSAGQLLADLEEAFAPVAGAGVEVVVTSTPIINETIIVELQDAQVTSLLVTLGAVTLLLAVSYWLRERRPGLGVITAAPVVLALLWTFGMMAATGIPFGPVTTMIAALAIGIGIPYSIHVTNRFEEDRRRLPSGEAVRSTVRHTGGALAGSAMTTCAGFGVLMTSSLVPFQQFGAVTVYAIGFALLAATLVLPSALVLWDRWHRSRGRAEGPSAAAPDRVLVLPEAGDHAPAPVTRSRPWVARP